MAKRCEPRSAFTTHLDCVMPAAINQMNGRAGQFSTIAISIGLCRTRDRISGYLSMGKKILDALPWSQNLAASDFLSSIALHIAIACLVDKS